MAGGHWQLGDRYRDDAARGPVNLRRAARANPLFDAYWSARRRLGINVIERRQARLAGARTRRGRSVFGADQNAGRNGIFVPFFGHGVDARAGTFAPRTRPLLPRHALSKMGAESNWSRSTMILTQT